MHYWLTMFSSLYIIVDRTHILGHWRWNQTPKKHRCSESNHPDCYRVSLPKICSIHCLTVDPSDILSMDKYMTAFETNLPAVAVGKYTDEVHRPDSENWTNFLKKDIVLAPSHVCPLSSFHKIFKLNGAISQVASRFASTRRTCNYAYPFLSDHRCSKHQKSGLAPIYAYCSIDEWFLSHHRLAFTAPHFRYDGPIGRP